MKTKNFLVALLLAISINSHADQPLFALEQFDISELRVYAIYEHPNCALRYARIMDPKGFIYDLEVGEDFGKHGGRVTKIAVDTVFYTELLPDGHGGLFERKGEIKRHHLDSQIPKKREGPKRGRR